MAKKAVGGRPAIYGPKDSTVQVRSITKVGARLMNTARTVVRKVSKWPGKVSDADVVEYLLRSWYVGREAANEEIAPEE